jgi:hypothetical protein
MWYGQCPGYLRRMIPRFLGVASEPHVKEVNPCSLIAAEYLAGRETHNDRTALRPLCARAKLAGLVCLRRRGEERETALQLFSSMHVQCANACVK